MSNKKEVTIILDDTESSQSIKFKEDLVKYLNEQEKKK